MAAITSPGMAISEVATKNPDQPPIISKLLAKIIPLFSRAAGETPEQTEERRARAEAIFAGHADPIVGTKGS